MIQHKTSRSKSYGRGNADFIIGLIGVAVSLWIYLIVPQAAENKAAASAKAQQADFIEQVGQYMRETEPPRAAATIQTIGQSINGVKAFVEVQPGATPEHGIKVTVRYEVPTDDRICIGMTAYESISMGRGYGGGMYRYDSSPSESAGCIDKAPDGKAYLAVQVHRNDIPTGGSGLQGMTSDPQREEAKALRPDGFILVNLKLGDKYQLQRVESPYFSKLAVKTVER